MNSQICPYYTNDLCRSCSLLALPESERTAHKDLAFKTKASLALGAEVKLVPLWQPQSIFPSRNKAKLSVSGTLENPIIGLIDREFKPTELLNCPLHHPELNEILVFLKTQIQPLKLIPYDIARRTGELKGFILKSNHDGSEILLRFILRSKEALSRIQKAIPTLISRFPNLKVISVNIQPIPAAILEGEEEIILTSEKVIWEDFNGFELAFAPQSFSQVTSETARALYAEAARIVEQTQPAHMLDLFCGAGGFSFAVAKHIKSGHGIELSAGAIRSAELARNRNSTPHLHFSSGDVEAYLKSYDGPHPDLVLANPPRRGLSGSILESIQKIKPKTFLYSSCNPETLFRDLKIVFPEYEVVSLSPFDMFPLTEHLEVLAHLRLRDHE